MTTRALRSKRWRLTATRAAFVAWAAWAWLGARTASGDETKVTCIAAADRGQELRDEGKYGAAREAFVACARDACPAVIAKSCLRWLTDLDAALPTVVIGARDAEGRDVAAARVLVDGVVVAEKLDGMPRSIDPGPHVVRVEREGSAPSEVHVVVRAAEKGRAIVATLAPLAAPPAAVPPHGTAPPSPAEPEPSATPPPEPPRSLPGPTFFTPRNTTALSLLGAAAVSTAVAVYLGAEGRSQASIAAGYRAEYPSNACAHTASSTCTAWSDAVDAQNRDAFGSDALFGAAGALAAFAVATWVLWPHASPPRAASVVSVAAAVAPGRAGLRIGGSF
jgi:hypothetical protein